MSWVAVAVAAVGAGTSLYGANQQKKANQAAQASNAQLQDKQNDSAWGAYLLSRGVNPSGAKAGSLPTNPQAVNAKLPLWATVRRTPAGGLSTSRALTAPSGGGRTWQGLGIGR